MTKSPTGDENLERRHRFFEMVFLDDEIERHALPAEDVESAPEAGFCADRVWDCLRHRLHRSGPWLGPKPTVREIFFEDCKRP